MDARLNHLKAEARLAGPSCLSGLAGVGLALLLLLPGCSGAISPRNTELPRAGGAPIAASTAADGEFIYGISVAEVKNAPLVAEMGFTWMKAHVSWSAIEPGRGKYEWTELYKAIRAARDNRLGLLVRVDQAPAWSHPSNGDPNAPPDAEYYADWERFLQEMAARGRGRVQAYEIWNEPNLAIEWGGNSPDPSGYQRLLRAAYHAVKAGDQDALVVSAGLANTDDLNDRAMDDSAFLRELYEAGAAPYFDVLGYHPHGGPESPWGTRFLKTERQRQIMEEYGDGRKAVWATEMAWVLGPPAACSSERAWETRLWESVSADEQARHLVDAFELVQARWPWMNAIFVFNLDFNTAPWYDPCDPMSYESVLERDGSPGAAFRGLRDMAKPGAARVPILTGDYPQGPLVKGSCDDIWVVVDGMRRWVPDVETLAAAGYLLDEVEALQNDEIKAIPLGSPIPSVTTGRYPDNMLLLDTSSGRIDVMLGGQRHWIPDVRTFTYNRFCWENVLEVTPAELRDIPVGDPLPRAPQRG
ncbi:MAG: hypothetical protein M1370_08515 [Bacteroidetes bacterium]|nr:hypothetical protein [Bacteroidota bacterium]MCL5027119.1 hypothetical protein [Chloroflexota bacterium]